MPTTIKLKNGSGAPLAGDLVQGEPALDLTNKRLYTEDSGGSVIEVGINPTEITTGDVTATGTSTLTTVDINGGAIDATTIGGSTPAAGSFTTVTGSGDMNIDSGTLFVDASTNRIGIGTTTPSSTINATSTGSQNIRLYRTDAGVDGALRISDGNTTCDIVTEGSKPLLFSIDSAEKMRLDSSGHLLVGKATSDAGATAGLEYHKTFGVLYLTDSGGESAIFNRLSSDGNIVRFRKDGTNVGSIGSVGDDIFIDGLGSNGSGIRFESNQLRPRSNGSDADNTVDLGGASFRFDDVYATNGTIQTSDRNEKQDIEELSEAEQRVAVAAKALLRKFRWKDAVEEKGDDARIHFGIIAQDLQAAFEAEGLDAGRYAMFIHSEWWETYTDVPAVEAQDAVYETVVIPAVTEERLVSEAVLDEEGNEIEVAVYETVVIEEETTEERLVSEAVEAKEAYTRTDTYETEEEAPEGAVKKSRMGVRYSELLAFIIAAI